MDQQRLLRSLQEIGQPRVLVVGDLILDRYTWGNAERVSQEAPVIVLRADRQEVRPGGAANVAQMAAALGSSAVTAIGVAGNDAEATELEHLLIQRGIQPLVIRDPARPTTLKERFIGRAQSRHPHQILRVDRESTEPVPQPLEAELVRRLQAVINNHDIVLLSDYRKGVCTPSLLAQLMRLAGDHGVPVFVDPGRGVDPAVYRGCSVLKPNRSETATVVGRRIESVDDARWAACRLVRMLDLDAAVITLDRDGLVLGTAGGELAHYPTRTRNVYDITGAGDMVLAALGVFYAGGASLADAVQLANVAAGLEVEKIGVVPVVREEIAAELAHRAVGTGAKVLSLEELRREVERRRQAGQRIVFTNGCFDLLHAGHLHYLQSARSLGDCLIVAINSDNSVRRLKGPDRPVIPERERAALLAALECVDYVTIFDDETPHRLLRTLRPDILIKGGTYREDQVVGREVVQSYGGRVVVGPAIPGLSTTAIVERIRASAPRRVA